MGIFSRFERGMEDGLEGAAGKIFNAPITPVQISKKAERAMHREKMVGAGKQYAPTLYTVLVNPQDDARLFGYYPTLAGETETYLSAKAAEQGYLMDGQPLVRFIVDDGLRRGKFDVVAELVSAPIIAQLRQEEMQRYGLATKGSRSSQRVGGYGASDTYGVAQQHDFEKHAAQSPRPYTPATAVPPVIDDADDVLPAGARPEMAQRAHVDEPLPYVPENEIDRSIDYGEYTFNSQDWDSYQKHGPSSMPLPGFDDNQADDEESGFDLGRQAEVAVDASWGRQAEGDSDPFGFEDLSLDDDDAPEQSNVHNSLDFLPNFSEDDYAFSGDMLPSKDLPSNDLSGLDVQAYTPEQVDSREFMEPAHVEPAMRVPDTAMFAAGSRSADFAPDYDEVRARLINPAGTRSIDLAARRLIIGRSSSCDIMIDDMNASRNHAELRSDVDGVWVVNDLGSTNGTLVNGRRITSHRLNEGDRIRIGATDFIFTMK